MTDGQKGNLTTPMLALISSFGHESQPSCREQNSAPLGESILLVNICSELLGGRLRVLDVRTEMHVFSAASGPDNFHPGPAPERAGRTFTLCATFVSDILPNAPCLAL